MSLKRMPCPRCGSQSSGRYHSKLRRFLCVNTECPRCVEPIDYAPFLEEVARQTGRLFDLGVAADCLGRIPTRTEIGRGEVDERSGDPNSRAARRGRRAADSGRRLDDKEINR